MANPFSKFPPFLSLPILAAALLTPALVFGQNNNRAKRVPAGKPTILPAVNPADMPQGTPPPHSGGGDTISPPPKIEWKEISTLPKLPGFNEQPGLAGMFAGSQGLFLLIAGGTNFAAGQPSLDAPRAFWNKIYVLEKTPSDDGNHRYTWHPSGMDLPKELAFGASVSLPDGLLCIGGTDGKECLADCFLLKWNAATSKVESVEFPKLPTPLSHASAVKIDNVVYVLGGKQTVTGKATKTFLALDLNLRETPSAFGWQKLASWDGPPRLMPLASAGTDGEVESIYLCGGRNPGGGFEDFLTDLHRFDPKKKSWAVLGNALDPAGNSATLMGAPVFFVPPHHMVVVGGADEKLISLLEDNARRSAVKPAKEDQAEDVAESADRKKLTQLIVQNFPGYSRNVMAFDIISSEWTRIGSFPERPPVSTVVVPWDGSYVIPGGETGPGQRTNKIWEARVKKKAKIVE